MVLNAIGLNPEEGVNITRQPIKIDGPIMSHLEKVIFEYEKNAAEEWDKIVSTAASILSRCPSSQSINGKITGLALGKVQSGKTLSFTTLLALAYDNGYRLVVVLAGTKNPLLEQTYTRLTHDLLDEELNLTLFKNPSNNDLEIIQSLIYTDGRILLLVLKNKKRLDDVSRLLNDPDLKSKPVLIVDDEGDEASLNTQFRRGRRSSIYEGVLQLRDTLALHAYIAYTATPQANLLIDGLDRLSPDFAELVEPGAGYCGGSTFFGDNRDSFIRTVPASTLGYDASITDTLKHAIRVFFIGGAIRSLRGDKSTHSMLIHTSNLKVDHEVLFGRIQSLIILWKQQIELPLSDPSSKTFYVFMRQAYDELVKTVVSPPTWDSVMGQIKREIWLTQIWIVNSLPIGLDPVVTPFRLKNNIFVGGNMLGRGVTLKGLSVTYMTREARNDTNADTLEQRARWFGYKTKFLDVCRIFLTEQLKNRYIEILKHEDDFWGVLERNQRQGISIKEWPRMFRLDMAAWNLRPTRPQVADFHQFKGEGWYRQYKVILDPQLASTNIEIAKEFHKGLHGENRKVGNVTHFFAEDIPIEEIITNLLSNIAFTGTDWEDSYIIEYLTRLLISKKLTKLQVVVMNNGTNRIRAIDAEGKIQPMQGRSPNRVPGDKNYYPGDDAIHFGKAQLQIHFINAINPNDRKGINTISVCLYIPPNPEYDLKVIVSG